MTDIQPYQFEPEETLQDEDWFEESGIAAELLKEAGGGPGTLTVNSVYSRPR